MIFGVNKAGSLADHDATSHRPGAKNPGFDEVPEYNGGIMLWILRFVLAVAVLVSLSCADSREVPHDDDLDLFIEISARCAYVDRAYSDEKEILESEMSSLAFPPDWCDLVDTLLARYGADPEFWYDVYSEIAEKSREPSPSEESGDVD